MRTRPGYPEPNRSRRGRFVVDLPLARARPETYWLPLGAVEFGARLGTTSAFPCIPVVAGKERLGGSTRVSSLIVVHGHRARPLLTGAHQAGKHHAPGVSSTGSGR